MAFNTNTYCEDFNTGASSSSSTSSATTLEITRTASSVISAIKAVKSDGSGGVDYADRNTSFVAAQVLGISLSAGVIGSSITICTAGVIEDAFFGSFAVNEQLYLDLSGAITNSAPVVGWSVVLGKVLGNNQFMVEIKSPIKLL